MLVNHLLIYCPIRISRSWLSLYAILKQSDPIYHEGFDGAIWNGNKYKIKNAFNEFTAKTNDGEYNKTTFDRYTYIGDKVYFTAYKKTTENKRKFITFYIGTATAPTWEDIRFFYEMSPIDYTDYKGYEPTVHQTTFKDYYVVRRTDDEAVFINVKTGEITEKSGVKPYADYNVLNLEGDYLLTAIINNLTINDDYIDYFLYDEQLNVYPAKLSKTQSPHADITNYMCVFGEYLFWAAKTKDGFDAYNAINFKTGETPDDETLKGISADFTAAYEKSEYDKNHPRVQVGDKTFIEETLPDWGGFRITDAESGESKDITIARLKETSPEFAAIAEMYKSFRLYVCKTYTDEFVFYIFNARAWVEDPADQVPFIFFRYDVSEDTAYYIGYADSDVNYVSVVKLSSPASE